MFVCRRNSCRSQMAEGFARHLSDGRVTVVSSGLEASRVHPTAIAIMEEVGIDISAQTSDPLDDFHAETFDAVVSLCGCGTNLPPDWVTRSVFEDWQLDDPDGQPLETFRRVREEIRDRVQTLLARLTESA